MPVGLKSCDIYYQYLLHFTYPSKVESAGITARNWLYHNLTDTTEYVKYLEPVNDSYQSVDVGFRYDPFKYYLVMYNI